MAPRVGFVGAGMMAEALAKGFIKAGVASAQDVACVDTAEARKDVFRGLGATACDDLAALCARSDVLFIAVKPYAVDKVLREAAPALADGSKLVVSIAAGVTLGALEAAAGNGRVVRIMPNTPCLVGKSAAAMCLGSAATGADGETVKTLMGAVGSIHTVDEKLIDAVTGLSGSGPAYVFMMIEAMADGGVAAGLPRDVALNLAAGTVAGAAEMVLQTGMHPGALKDQVTSPAGTTIAGVHELERAGMRAAFMNAVTAAASRATELGKK